MRAPPAKRRVTIGAGDGTSAAKTDPRSMINAPSNSSVWQRGATALLRIVLLLGATLLMIGALLLGLVLATGVVLWALLRGRRPGPVNLRWGRMPRAGAFYRQSSADVVDVQVREVQGPPQR